MSKVNGHDITEFEEQGPRHMGLTINTASLNLTLAQFIQWKECGHLVLSETTNGESAYAVHLPQGTGTEPNNMILTAFKADGATAQQAGDFTVLRVTNKTTKSVSLLEKTDEDTDGNSFYGALVAKVVPAGFFCEIKLVYTSNTLWKMYSLDASYALIA